MKRLRLYVRNLLEAFWFLPGLMIAVAIGGAFLLLHLDGEYRFELEGTVVRLFSGEAQAARQLLGVLAGSLITVISIAFSITILALQQLATQYSPRVLRSFTGDRGNQTVLGTYLATFVYCLLVLRAIRDGSTGPEIVPSLSITFAVVLGLLCMGMLIYFISHVVGALQVEKIVQRIHGDFLAQVEEMFPDAYEAGTSEDTEAPPAQPGETWRTAGQLWEMPSDSSGFVQAIIDDELETFAVPDVAAVHVVPQVGEFIDEGQPIIQLQVRGTVDEDELRVLRRVVVVGHQRATLQDPLFAITQMVDIALRALSTGINDPGTAENVIYQLTDALSQLARRRLPPARVKFRDSPITFTFGTADWGLFIEEAYGQIRRTVRDNVRMTRTLTRQLRALAAASPSEQRLRPVRAQLEAIREQVQAADFTSEDRAVLMRELDIALQVAR